MSGAYPISKLLTEIVGEDLSCEVDFMTERLGYRDAIKGVRRLHLWIGSGEGHQRIIDQISRVTGRGAELERAIAETHEMKTREWEESWLEGCKAKAATFRPFLCADGTHTVPNGICIFGVTGGHSRWTVIKIPQRLLDLSPNHPALLLYMNRYKKEHKGEFPFLGKLTGFKLVRLVDYFQFDAAGRLVEHVQKPFRLGGCYVSLA
jgi:hypothetical protein